MDALRAVQSRYSGGSGWRRSPLMVDFKRPLQKPLWPWLLLVALALVVLPALATWFVV